MIASKETDCCFCGKTLASARVLVDHLLAVHEGATVGTPDAPALHFYRYKKIPKVVCFCGQKFTCFDFSQTTNQQRVINDFAAHLRREGGLTQHFEKTRWQAQMDALLLKGKAEDDWLDLFKKYEASGGKRFAFLKMLGEIGEHLILDNLDMDGFQEPL